MEPIKFEDNIREKLQEREISPSQDAWKKLHSKLESRPNKINKKLIWFAVAASFIGIFIIASMLFENDASTITNSSDFVLENQEALEKDDNNEKNLPIYKNTNNIVLKETVPVEKTGGATIKKPFIKTDNSSDLAVISNNSVESDPQNIETIASAKSENTAIIIDLKVDEVVAQIQVLQKEEELDNAEEINTLLLKAQRDLYAGNMIPAKNKKVDATALLNAVEDDIETSFRDKVFDALGDGFEKVKTAVVERNN